VGHSWKMDNERIIAPMEAMHRKLVQEIRLVGSKVDSVGAGRCSGSAAGDNGGTNRSSRKADGDLDGSAGSAGEAARGEHS